MSDWGPEAWFSLGTLVLLVVSIENWWLPKAVAASCKRVGGSVSSRYRLWRYGRKWSIAQGVRETRDDISRLEWEREWKEGRKRTGELVSDAAFGVRHHEVHAALRCGMTPSQYLGLGFKDKAAIDMYLLQNDKTYRRLFNVYAGEFEGAA